MKAAFLDRDGVINVDKGYVYRWQDFEFVPGVIEAMHLLMDAEYALIVATNQSGIARGYYTEADYVALTEKYTAYLENRGIRLTGIYHCPHHPQGAIADLTCECDCRKPAPGMLLKAAREHGLSLEESVLIGDKSTDIEAARAAGLGASYLLASDAGNAKAGPRHPAGIFPNITACVEHLCAQTRHR